MMERSLRSVLLLFALLLISVHLWKSHGTPQHAPVAFVRQEGYGSVVRLRGGSPGDGIHNFPDGSLFATVINMALGGADGSCDGRSDLQRHLSPFVEATIRSAPGKCPEILVGKLKARDRILLGVPLDPAEMERADWEALDGVGPGIAGRIEIYRQENGGEITLESLRLVPGIGRANYQSIIKNF